MWSLDPLDLLFVGGFVAAICLAIAGLVTFAAPPGVPGFVGALRAAFLLVGAAFFLLGAAGAALVAVFES